MSHHRVLMSDLSAGQAYDLLSRVVVPRPIAFVSTLSEDGVPNLAPFSFFMAGGANPPSVVFCPVRSPQGEPKDTLRNIESTGEYVINIVTRDMAEGMNNTAFGFPHGVSEWPASGFTMAESEAVRPARVAESPVSLECRRFQTVEHGGAGNSAVYVIGEVLVSHIHPDHWADGLVVNLAPISRLGGPDYLDTAGLGEVGGKLFELPRPSAPPSASGV